MTPLPYKAVHYASPIGITQRMAQSFTCLLLSELYYFALRVINIILNNIDLPKLMFYKEHFPRFDND